MDQSKLRITVIGINYWPEPTGIAPYTTRLSESLAAEGHSVQVITGYPHYPGWKLQDGFVGWKSVEVINSVHVHRLRHFIPNRVNSLARMHLELSFGVRLLFARWNKPDVVVVVSPALFASLFAILRARFGLRRPASGIWVQDIYSRGIAELNNERSLSARVMQHVEGAILKSASRVTVIHDRFKRYISASLGVRESDISVIRNWTHLAATQTDRISERARWGWSEKDIVVLHAGNMGVKQSLENVVEAARLADSQSPRVRFVLLGNGNRQQEIKSLAKGVSSIQFIDPLPDEEFNRVLRSVDILLVNEMVGLREMAVPSKLTSYFSVGLPVIAATESDSTTAEEIDVARGGIRTDPGDPAALLAAAERLGNDPNLAAELGRAGARYAETTLSQDAAIMQYGSWVRELAATRRNAKSGATTGRSNQRSRGIRVD